MKAASRVGLTPSMSRFGLAPKVLVDGKYRLEKLLGVGGGGEVWSAAEAVDAEAWRMIALKVLKTPERSKRTSGSRISDNDWLHEARAVSRVLCTALPQILTVGTTDLAGYPSTPFIAMELLDGETLEARLSRGTMHWRKALAITRQIAIALDACHSVGVIHCDLKPRNVFLEGVLRQRVLVLDFGIASLERVYAKVPEATNDAPSANDTDTENDTDIGEHSSSLLPEVAEPPRITGTPGYISPERLSGLQPDYRDDAFALGVVLHRMIACRMPQRLPRSVEAVRKTGGEIYGIEINTATLERKFEPLDEAVPTTPNAVVALVKTLLGPAKGRPAKGQLAKFVDDVYRRPYGRPSRPYAGLEAFDKHRMGYLPGRARDIEPIVLRLEDQVALVLCGPSGTGKSSLAIAGVAARIDEEMLLGKEGWETVVLRPSNARQTLRVASENAVSPTKASSKGPSLGLFVVVDQLEEVLSLNVTDRHAFCLGLTTLIARSAAVVVGDRRIESSDTIRVVATVRDDFFGRVAALPELVRLPERNLYIVRGVDPNAARDVVLGPLKGTGYILEESSDVDVVADVARELERDPSALPLVQFALARLWDRRDRKGYVLRAKSWRAIGGIVGALGEAAQDLYDSLSPKAQQAARRLFLALFDAKGTRIVVDESTLDAAAVALIQRWVGERLVRRRVEVDGRAMIEPLHEALAKGWSQLGRWLEEVRADRELVWDAQRDAKRWARHGEPADMLWGGTLLKNRHVLQGIQTEPGRAFITESLAAAKRAYWVKRVLPAVVVSVVFAGWLYAYMQAENERIQRVQLEEAQKTTIREAHESALKQAHESALREERRQKTVIEKERKDAQIAAIKAKQRETALADLVRQLEKNYVKFGKTEAFDKFEADKKKIDVEQAKTGNDVVDPYTKPSPPTSPRHR